MHFYCYRYFTYHVSALIFFEAKQNVNQDHQHHNSIVVGHRQSRAKLPVVVCEHEGAEQNKSGTCVTDHLEDENGEVFSIQGFIFVPVKEKNKSDVFFSPFVKQACFGLLLELKILCLVIYFTLC